MRALWAERLVRASISCQAPPKRFSWGLLAVNVSFPCSAYREMRRRSIKMWFQARLSVACAVQQRARPGRTALRPPEAPLTATSGQRWRCLLSTARSYRSLQVSFAPAVPLCTLPKPCFNIRHLLRPSHNLPVAWQCLPRAWLA